MKQAELLKRTHGEVYRGDELRFIGMPIGGFFAGTVYLAGDGQLWNWDIFNQDVLGAVTRPNATFMGDSLNAMSGANYVEPSRAISPFRQEFSLWEENETPRRVRFGEILFRGEYPIARVSYGQADADVEMSLEAFSPFCPLNVDDSSFPATTMTFRVRNTGTATARYRIAYALENPVLTHSKSRRNGFVLKSIKRTDSLQFIAETAPTEKAAQPEIRFADWSDGTYGGWTPTGSAFGTTPQRVTELPGYMGNVQAETAFVVNSHQTRNGEDLLAGDGHRGRLTSPEFRISHSYINLRVGGGPHARKTCINLEINGEVVLSVTGNASNVMSWQTMSVARLRDKTARLTVVDEETGAWGNISLGEVIFADQPASLRPLTEETDFGTFSVSIPGGADVQATDGKEARISRQLTLAPGETAEVTFIVAWHFPNTSPQMPERLNWCASRWEDSEAVANEIARRWKSLRETTQAWNRTWYDSTLPHWFLDRTFQNLSTLATSTCHRFASGRFYFWEGVGCCAGTCTHVWGYAQAIGRVFPEVERYLREKVDFGRAFHSDTGAIDYRGEYGTMVFHDGQCMCILRAYREHQMSPDAEFLSRIWPSVKRAMEYLISQDSNQDGVLENAQFNTLDTAWYGKIAWISGLYVATLRASEAMAHVMKDEIFAARCRALAERGAQNLVRELYNGEYFINLTDPAHPEANNTNVGCHIDQLLGQAWALQLGLPRVVPVAETQSALQALYRHNFFDDVWEYRRKMKAIPGGRWYATPGEAGLIMCSFPRGGAKESIAKGSDAWAVGYFNECMSGFEHQVAAHMIAEGMVREGLSIEKAIHSRYSAKRRNPYNEVECSDHYGRAMASYGAYVSLTGFSVDGSNHRMSFRPKTGAGAFRCAFINEQGWGTFDRSAGGKETVTYQYRVNEKQ